MTLSREEVVTGLASELQDFEKLLRSVGPAEWTKPTRCEGWVVRDLGAHVVGVYVDIAAGRLEGLALPETAQRHLDERVAKSASDVADELASVMPVILSLAEAFDDAAWNGPTGSGIQGTLGESIELLWIEAYIHADDIRHALGRPTETSDGLRASLSYLSARLAEKDWGPATLAFDGLGRFDVGAGGREITGDAHTFVLAATGRSDPAAIGLDASVNVFA